MLGWAFEEPVGGFEVGEAALLVGDGDLGFGEPEGLAVYEHQDGAFSFPLDEDWDAQLLQPIILSRICEEESGCFARFREKSLGERITKGRKFSTSWGCWAYWDAIGTQTSSSGAFASGCTLPIRG